MMHAHNLRKQYHIFMRELIDNKYLKNFNAVKVLGESFMSNYYIVIFKCFTSDNKLRIYIIVENINNPVTPLNLRASKNTDGYVVTKQNLLYQLPEKLYKKLIDNGLFEKLETAQNDNDSTFSVHRLALCLYVQCLNKEVHHINFNPKTNAICNLISVTESEHVRIHELSEKDAIAESIKEQNKLKLQLARKKKNTLAENSIFELLELRISGMSARKIERKIFKRVKKSKIQEILNYFFYAKDFMMWLKNQSQKSLQQLSGQFKNRWEYILKFDEYIKDENLDTAYLQKYLQMDDI